MLNYKIEFLHLEMGNIIIKHSKLENAFHVLNERFITESFKSYSYELIDEIEYNKRKDKENVYYTESIHKDTDIIIIPYYKIECGKCYYHLIMNRIENPFYGLNNHHIIAADEFSEYFRVK